MLLLLWTVSTLFSATLTDLTERDDGTYSTSLLRQTKPSTFTLKVLDCAVEVKLHYGETWNLFLPEDAEILEFTPLHSLDPPVVLWNRSNPQVQSVHSGQVNQSSWQVQNVTQSENGFYDIRQKDNTLLCRTQLKVEENVRHYKKFEDKHLLIEYPWDNGPWLATFKPNGGMDNITLIKDGQKYSEDWFGWRLEIESAGPMINPLRLKDSGTFEFRDRNGNLALIAHLVVEKPDDAPPPVPLLVFIIVAFVLGGAFCCWMCRSRIAKCCKRDKPAPQTAAPFAVHYHGESQPVSSDYSAVPSSSAVSHQPVNPLQKPTAAHHEQPVGPEGGSAPAP